MLFCWATSGFSSVKRAIKPPCTSMPSISIRLPRSRTRSLLTYLELLKPPARRCFSGPQWSPKATSWSTVLMSRFLFTSSPTICRIAPTLGRPPSSPFCLDGPARPDRLLHQRRGRAISPTCTKQESRMTGKVPCSEPPRERETV